VFGVEGAIDMFRFALEMGGLPLFAFDQAVLAEVLSNSGELSRISWNCGVPAEGKRARMGAESADIGLRVDLGQRL